MQRVRGHFGEGPTLRQRTCGLQEQRGESGPFECKVPSRIPAWMRTTRNRKAILLLREPARIRLQGAALSACSHRRAGARRRCGPPDVWWRLHSVEATLGARYRLAGAAAVWHRELNTMSAEAYGEDELRERALIRLKKRPSSGPT